MKSYDNVVGEDTLWILSCSASLEWNLNLVAEITFASCLTGTVTIEIRVGDAIKSFVEFQVHLWSEWEVLLKFFFRFFVLSFHFLQISATSTSLECSEKLIPPTWRL